MNHVNPRTKSWTLVQMSLASLALVACKSPAPKSTQSAQEAPKAAQVQGAEKAQAHGAAAHGQAARAKVHGAAPQGHGHAAAHGYHHPAAGKKAAPVDATPGQLLVGSVSAKVDKGWVREAPSNAMRKAQYKIPGKGGDASLVVFQFPGGAGGAKDNLDRWISQFAPEAAKSAKTKTISKGGLTIHSLDVTGNYQARPMPGQDPKSVPTGKQRLLALVVEGSGDPLYYKLLGPIPTVEANTGAWTTLVNSLSAGK